MCSGKYYLVDSAYPNTIGYLAPYKESGVRYHIPELSRGRQCGVARRGMKEEFNYRHSCLRGTVERTFGEMKATWKILDDRMPQVTLQKQIQIIIAVCTLHNFIRLHRYGIQMSPRPPSTTAQHDDMFLDSNAKQFMNQFRDQLATDMWESAAT